MFVYSGVASGSPREYALGAPIIRERLFLIEARELAKQNSLIKVLKNK